MISRCDSWKISTRDIKVQTIGQWWNPAAAAYLFPDNLSKHHFPAQLLCEDSLKGALGWYFWIMQQARISWYHDTFDTCNRPGYQRVFFCLGFGWYFWYSQQAKISEVFFCLTVDFKMGASYHMTKTYKPFFVIIMSENN